MRYNYPHAIYLRLVFCVTLPFQGTALPQNLQRGLDEAYAAVAPLVKLGTTVYVKVGVPGKYKDFTPAEKEMLEQVQGYVVEALNKPWRGEGQNEKPKILEETITKQ